MKPATSCSTVKSALDYWFLTDQIKKKKQQWRQNNHNMPIVGLKYTVQYSTLVET